MNLASLSRITTVIRSSSPCKCIQRIPVLGLTRPASTDSGSKKSHTDNINTEFVNRNPRNLEQMGIAKKQKGWQFQYPPVEYYHKVVFESTNKHTTAYIQHTSGKIIISASTKEFAIGKHLYSYTDVAAAVNIGRVLAQRCLETGITCACLETPEHTDQSDKHQQFVKHMEEMGFSFKEPEVYEPPYMPGMDYDDLDAMEDVRRRQDLVLEENPRKWGTRKSFKL